MRVKRLTRCALLPAIALAIFVHEAQIPIPFPVPGMKLGLSNIITLFALFSFGWKDALAIVAIRILLGYLADLLFGRWFRAQKSIHSFCEREHCDCDEEEGSVFLAALRHTLKIAVMLIAVNFALNLLFHYIGVERLSGTVLNRPVLGELILALFGLIPNCSVSVVVTESYLSGVLGLGGLFAGLLTNAGIGQLELLRTTPQRVQDIAAQVGYESQGRFALAFYDVLRLTPLE